MRRLASILVLFFIACTYALASSITLPNTFQPNTLIQSAQVNSNFTSITNVVNGSLDNSNLSATANINPSKLNLTTAYLNLVSASTDGFGVGQSGDTVARGGIYGDGSLRLGPGGSTAADIEWVRSAANTMQLAIPAGGTPKLDLNGGTLVNALTVGNGGTGITTTPTNGQIPIGNGTTYVASTIAATTGITVTNGAGTITLNNQATNALAQGRLTFSSTLPVPTTDLTSQGTLYYLPYTGTKISLWDSTDSKIVVDDIGTSGVSLSLSGSSGMYDVFASDTTGSGTVTLSITAWTNATTRATALATGANLGVLVLSGTQSSRYLGSIFLTATNASEDKAGDRALFNYYNRVERSLVASDPTASWTYASNTARAADANTTDGQGRVTVVIGVAEEPVNVTYSLPGNANATTGVGPEVGIGVDSTTVNSAQITNTGAAAAGQVTTSFATYVGVVAIGQHRIQALEASSGNGSQGYTAYGGGATWPASSVSPPIGGSGQLLGWLRN